jgi:hypothetical protein
MEINTIGHIRFSLPHKLHNFIKLEKMAKGIHQGPILKSKKEKGENFSISPSPLFTRGGN